MIINAYNIDTTNSFQTVKVWDNESDPIKKERLLIGKIIGEDSYPWLVLDTEGETESYRYMEYIGEKSILGRLSSGDILIKEDYKVKVVAVIGELVFITTRDMKEAGDYLLKSELINKGYTLADEEKEEDLIHLTIQDISDGKGKGIKPELIRIKE
jgi:hypothetical protein